MNETPKVKLYLRRRESHHNRGQNKKTGYPEERRIIIKRGPKTQSRAKQGHAKMTTEQKGKDIKRVRKRQKGQVTIQKTLGMQLEMLTILYN